MSGLTTMITQGTSANEPQEMKALESAEQELAVVHGPQYVHCYRPYIYTPRYSTWYDKPTIKKGDNFNVVGYVRHSELLGDLEARFDYKIYVHNVATCQAVDDYCIEVNGVLEKDSTWLRVTASGTATRDGIFVVSNSVILPSSELFDYNSFTSQFAVYED